MVHEFRGTGIVGRLLPAVLTMLAAALAASAPAAAPLQAPPKPLEVESFAQLPFLTMPVLSPDGSRVAARVMVNGSERIGVWALSAPRDQPPHLVMVRHVDSFTWAGDNLLLIKVTGLSSVEFRGFTLPTPARRIQVHDIAANKTTTLGNSAGLVDELIFVDPAARYVLLSSQPSLEYTPRVQRIDLASGEIEEVEPSRRGVWSWFADGNGVVRVGVDYGERRTRIYYRPTAGAELRRIETRRNLADGSVIDTVRFISNTDRGFIITNAGTGRFALYEYDFATDTPGAAIFAHDEVDIDSAVFGADGSVEGVIYEDDRPRVRWLDPDLTALQQRIDAALPGKTNTILNRSRDGNRVLIFSSAADDPGTYYVFDQGERRLEIFASPYDGLDGQAFAPVRAVRYRSRDGLTINAYLTLPRGRPERGLPLIVMPHGGPFARTSWQFDPEVQFLASRGYAVLQPNFRGSTGYGREFVERGYGQFGSGMIDDIDDGVDWLIGQGIADPARICAMGASYGGYAALWAATRSPQRYRCAISWAGPSDLKTMLRYDLRSYLPQRYERERRRQLQGEERTDLDAVSPLRQAQHLTVPVLIAHGEQDIRVPVNQSRDLVRALTRRRANVESAFYPRSGHSFATPEDSADFLRRVEAFLTRHNPAAPPRTAEPTPASPSPAGVSNSPPSG